MRTTFSVILISIIVMSCSKNHEKDRKLENFKNQVVGKWEIEKNVCGECSISNTTYPEGNGNIIVLSNDGSFERLVHDSLTFRGKFLLSMSEECSSSNPTIAITTNEISNSTPHFATIESEKLTLSTPNCYADGSITIYRRIQ